MEKKEAASPGIVMETSEAASSGIVMEKEAESSEMAVEEDWTPRKKLKKGWAPGQQAAGVGEDWKLRRKGWTPEERKAAWKFFRAVMDDYEVYAAMTEEDVEEEYRRAGKLHKYDPETELVKRYARVAKKHPPPAGYSPMLEEGFKLIQDEDED